MLGSVFGLPSISHGQWLQIIVAMSVPLVMFRITQMTAVLTWIDITVALGLVITPVVVILGLQGVLGGASSIGILSAVMLSSLGVIVTD